MNPLNINPSKCLIRFWNNLLGSQYRGWYGVFKAALLAVLFALISELPSTGHSGAAYGFPGMDKQDSTPNNPAAGTDASGGISISGKNVMIFEYFLDPDHGSALKGTYIFQVMNHSNAPQRLETRLPLPKNITDFKPMQGIERSEFKLGEESFEISKEFPSGVHMVGLEYMIKGWSGMEELVLSTAFAIDHWDIFWPIGSFTISSPFFSEAEETKIGEMPFMYIGIDKPLSANSDIKLLFSGLPQGRDNLWFLGLFVSIFALLAMFFLAWKRNLFAYQVGGGAGKKAKNNDDENAASLIL